jgi:hypothetical protein
MLVQQYILELQVAVDARLVVDIADGADELGENALNFGGFDSTLFQDVVVEFVAWTVLEYQPDQALGDYDLVQAGDVRMCELAMVVDLAREVPVVFLRALEHDLLAISPSRLLFMQCHRRTLEPLLSLCEAR